MIHKVNKINALRSKTIVKKTMVFLFKNFIDFLNFIWYNVSYSDKKGDYTVKIIIKDVYGEDITEEYKDESIFNLEVLKDLGLIDIEVKYN